MEAVEREGRLSVHVAPMAEDDVPVVAELWLRARKAAIPSIPAPVHADDDVRKYFSDVVAAFRQTWVARLDTGQVVGLLVLDADIVDHLYVHPAFMNRGIGSELIALAKRVQPARLELWTFQSNTGARRFYERHGFVAVEETAGDNEEGEPDVRYSWRGFPA